MNIIKKLEDKLDFNSSEVAISDFILNNKEKILEMSVQELAHSTYSSTSTIVRLCKKMGLKGYQHFKIVFSANLQTTYEAINNVNANFPFSGQDSYIEISKKIQELSTESLAQTQELLTNDLLESTVELMLKSKRTAIFGAGDTYLAGLFFQNRMMKINQNIIIPTIPYEDRHLALTFGPDDCAIILSYSGENKDIFLLSKILHSNGTKIISITSKLDSHIAKISDIIIPIFNKESKSIKFSTFSSQIAFEYVLNTLFSCLFIINFEENEKLRIQTETLFKDTRF